MKPTVMIYTDGGASPNPGPGGWAAILRCEGHEKRLSGAASDTTNNRMELRAAIEALRVLSTPCYVVMNTDSKYLMRGFTDWLPGWQRRDWITANKTPVKNQDLWQELAKVAEKHHIRWYHVPAHSGNVYNELCDELATYARESLVD